MKRHLHATDLVGPKEMADRLGISYARVRQIKDMKGFPDPVKDIDGPLWCLAEVKDWRRQWMREYRRKAM